MVATVGYIALTLLAVYIYFCRFNTRVPAGLRLPPGPQRHLLIGNLLDIPRKREWLTFNRWAKEYGDLVYLNVLGMSLLFVNSFEVAQELFGKRGNIYSNRFKTTLIEMTQLKWIFIFMPFGEAWRRSRALFNQYFGLAVVQNYQKLQQSYVKKFLERVYQTPNDYRRHIRFMLGAIVIEATYGIKVTSENDRFLGLSEDTMTKLTEAGVPGTYMVDILPILKYVPAWFLGARFRRELKALRRQAAEMVNSPIIAVKEAMSKGNAFPSVASSMIEQFTNDPDRPSDCEDLIRYVPGAAYIAAIDTMDCAALQFFFAMVLNPEVQRKAQNELDSVVGPETFPALSDRENLPYVQAIVHEIMRWNTAVNIGLPHVLDQDDIIGEYFIPKDDKYGNWQGRYFGVPPSMGRTLINFAQKDLSITAHPFPILPSDTGEVCPGRYFAENTLFLLVASVLYTFNIFPVEGNDGPEYPTEDFDSGVVLRPKSFNCRIIPRSPTAMKLLEEMRLSN